ncbi:flagellar basal body-associated FliL family protein [Marinivivus vitaminiproducens]|uniref:flagellar basal body-associated FliL family protein n=1 Tax=Marinivivus vitaminiproducens TaxID=3035935 RepID=UPI0027A6044B|nr:flagellar basal body-associated FliL family protein [Geminicoccaceae bacterium SCSIO 64248]
MRRSLIVIAGLLGLGLGGGAGSYWYLTHAQAEAGHAEPPPVVMTFVDLGPRFIVPMIRESRVRSMVVLDLRLEVRSDAEEQAIRQQPRLRDSLINALFVLAGEGAFDADLYDAGAQAGIRTVLDEAARAVLGEGLGGVLITEFVRQDT